MLFSLTLAVLGVLMGTAYLQHPKFGVLLNDTLAGLPRPLSCFRVFGGH